MPEYPLVSVVIPTYNRAHIICHAINSVRMQTYPNIQLIIVDDGSTDNTREVVARFPDVEYHYKPNGGQASARNHGLTLAKGRYFATLDSDDLWYPAFVETLVEKLEAHGLDFAFGNWYLEMAGGVTKSFLDNFDLTKDIAKRTDTEGWYFPEYEEIRSLNFRGCVCPSSGLLYRRTSIPTEWDTQMNIADDWCMTIEVLLQQERRVAFTFERLWFKRFDFVNVYENRSRIELSEKLYVDDLMGMLNRFAGRLKHEERSHFREVVFLNLIRLSHHHRRFDRKGRLDLSARFLWRAFLLDPVRLGKHFRWKVGKQLKKPFVKAKKA